MFAALDAAAAAAAASPGVASRLRLRAATLRALVALKRRREGDLAEAEEALHAARAALSVVKESAPTGVQHGLLGWSEDANAHVQPAAPPRAVKVGVGREGEEGREMEVGWAAGRCCIDACIAPAMDEHQQDRICCTVRPTLYCYVLQLYDINGALEYYDALLTQLLLVCTVTKVNRCAGISNHDTCPPVLWCYCLFYSCVVASISRIQDMSLFS